jgi:hypothetical protein
MKDLVKFLRSVFSESDGTGSWSRLGSLFLTVAIIGWVTHVVLKTHAIPDLGGPAGFLAAGNGSLYGTNQLKSIVSAITGKAAPAPPTP